MRGVAALLVTLGHARALTFSDWSGGGLTNAVFYAVTSLGSVAVIVFFVLSGFWVGGPLIRRVRQDRLDLVAYTAARLSRLWTVLFPALVLTGIVVGLGSRLAPGSAVYRVGDFHGVAGDPKSVLDPLVFIGNLAFLQGIAVPEYGGNGPLWSLAYEFWFYSLFPLLLLVLTARRTRKPVLVILLVLCGSLAGVQILMYMAIWLLGVVAYVVQAPDWLSQRPVLAKLTKLAAGLPLLLVVSWTIRPGGHGGFVNDALIGGATALVVLVLRGYDQARLTAGLRWAPATAAFSYSLYAIHVPVIQFVVAMFGRYGSPAVLFVSAVFTSLVISWLFCRLFERRTAAVRRRIERALRWKPARVGQFSRPKNIELPGATDVSEQETIRTI